MAEEDSLFGLDIVRDFILAKGGKTTNHALVTHFKSFLNNPRWKIENRQKFKDIVNTLATVKLDESGEKVLVLKRKYRDINAAPSVLDTPSSQVKDPNRVRPKAKKAKLAGQFEAGLVSQSPQKGAGDSETQNETENITSTNESGDAGPSLSEMIAGELASIGVSSAENTERPRSASPAPQPIVQSLDEARSDHEFVESPEAKYPMVEEDIAEEEPPLAEIPAVEIQAPEVAGNDIGAAAAAPPGDDDRSISADSGISGEGSVRGEADGASMASSGADSLLSTPVLNKKMMSGQSAVLEEKAVSVRARASQFNKIDSQSNLHAHPMHKKHEKTPRAAGAEDDDSSSEASMSISLTDIERKWMLDAAQGDYQELAKSMLSNPKLSHYRDFITGYTALHWGAKHGNMDILKLLAGSPEGVNVNAKTHGGYTALHLASIQGHENVIELLVQVYKADPDIRDNSGRKAKQYLKHSASTRAQQLLQPRRIHTSGGSNQANFRRMGSYNSKIRSVGGAPFGIQGGVAMRKSWTVSGQMMSESPSPTRSPSQSPSQSPRQIRRIQSEVETNSMPPPQSIPIRRQRSRPGDSRENLSDSELPHPSYLVNRASSDSNLIQTESGV